MHEDRETQETVDLMLTRILCGETDEGDIEMFVKWIKDYGHEKYFEQFKELWHAYHDEHLPGSPVANPLDTFLKYIWNKQKKHRSRKLTYAVSSAVAAVVLFGIFLFPTDRWLPEQSGMNQNLAALRYNTDSVKLELADGTVVDPASDGTVSRDGVEIKVLENGNREISYENAGRSKVENPHYNSLSIPSGQRVTVTLSDGTKVWLNSNSYLKYPVVFGRYKRSVTLSGRAYFEVSKSDVPFIVTTNGLEVEVLGTSFDVETGTERRNSSVILVEGSVKVNAERQNVLIRPNQQLSVNREDGTLLTKEVDAKTLTLWKDGILVLQNQTFDEMLESISSWYGVDIINNATVLSGERFNGRFDREDIETAIKTIAISAKIGYRVVDGTLVIENL